MAQTKTITACLKFAKDHIDVPQGIWDNVLRTDETNIEQHNVAKVSQLL